MQITQYPSLKDRTVVVTGGGSGIGADIVRAFAANGSHVAFFDIQEDVSRALAGELTGTGATVDFVHCDLTDIKAVQDSLARVKQRFGPVAALVNNAANDKRQKFLDVTPDDFDWMMSVNMRHAFFAAQAVVPQMRELGYGSIINMTSGAWVRGTLDMQAYCTAKAAVLGFSNSLARELGRDRIRVNALAPGMVITERQRALWYPDNSKIDESRKLQCIPDPVEGTDVAKVCLFLASDDSRMMTKQFLLVNGGMI